MMSSTTRRAALGVLAAAALALAGCSGKSPGAVGGKVSYRGEPVPAGEVHFLMKEKGVGATAKLDAGGQFKFDAPLAPGTYAVAVVPSPAEPTGPGGAAKPAAAAPAFPAKYQDPLNSGLTCEVKPGKNDIPIVLTD
jgi:hypothetical protein